MRNNNCCRGENELPNGNYGNRLQNGNCGNGLSNGICGNGLSNGNCGSGPQNTIYRYVYITGPQGPAGADGESVTLEASTNRNDTTQTVQSGGVVSITGTNVLTNDADMLFVNNTVRLNSAGLYLITTTLEASGSAGTYNFAITVDSVEYAFVLTINTGATTGTVSHTIYLNIATTPTVISINNKGSASATIEKAELDVVKLV